MSNPNESHHYQRAKSPRLLSLTRMRSILEPHLQQLREGLYIGDELAILNGNSSAFRLMMRQDPPFCINDHRLGIVLRGTIDTSINLVEKHITAGKLLFLGPGTIVSPLGMSDDLLVSGFVLSSAFSMPFAPGQLPAAFNGQVRDFQLSVPEADLCTARHIVDTLWHVVHQEDYNREMVSSLVAAQMYHYDRLYRRITDQQQRGQSRAQTIFDRFVQLVNQYAREHHQMSFYAERMCLTERYLGTVIREVSGVTGKEWIDRALVMLVQVELRHTEKSVAQIADEMCFPNTAFFCKYFKRLVSMTPTEYRIGRKGESKDRSD